MHASKSRQQRRNLIPHQCVAKYSSNPVGVARGLFEEGKMSIVNGSGIDDDPSRSLSIQNKQNKQRKPIRSSTQSYEW